MTYNQFEDEIADELEDMEYSAGNVAMFLSMSSEAIKRSFERDMTAGETIRLILTGQTND